MGFNNQLISGEEITLIDTAGIRRKYDRGRQSAAARSLVKSIAKSKKKKSGGDGAGGSSVPIMDEEGIEFAAINKVLAFDYHSAS